MEAPLHGGLVLEVELVEHALAKLPHDRTGVERRERGAQRRQQALEQRQVLAD